MCKCLGVICVILGVACLLGAVGFVAYNRREADNAAKITQSYLADVQLAAQVEKTEQKEPQIEDDPETEGVPTEMPTVQVDGYDCIGVLSIPVLELELPVLTDWSYTKLKKAPCLYYGSYFEKDFVIAAHNYQAHFGRLSELQSGDLVVFTDVQGVAHCYEVVLLETLPKEATLEMITSGFDLSLYTCTPGGGSRVTARCKIFNP